MPGIKLGVVADGDVSVLDFKAFIDGSHKQDVADAMLTSLKDTGFVYLANHSLPKNKIDEMFKLVSMEFMFPISTDWCQDQVLFRPSLGNQATSTPSTQRSAPSRSAPPNIST
jgi:isopenicillin N synthase-like dioxygenase